MYMIQDIASICAIHNPKNAKLLQPQRREHLKLESLLYHSQATPALLGSLRPPWPGLLGRMKGGGRPRRVAEVVQQIGRVGAQLPRGFSPRQGLVRKLNGGIRCSVCATGASPYSLHQMIMQLHWLGIEKVLTWKGFFCRFHCKVLLSLCAAVITLT